jgi:hypothetical protein
MFIDSGLDLRNDTRILVKAANAKHADTPLFGVFHRPDDTFPYIVCDNGVTYYTANQGFEARQELDGQPQRVHVAWSLPLPNLADDEIIPFYHSVKSIADHIQKERYYQHPALFYIDEVNDQFAQARLVYSTVAPHRSPEPADGVEEFEVLHGQMVSASYPILLDKTKLPEMIQIGDLILTSDISCTTYPETEDAAEVVVTHPEMTVILGRGISFDEVERYIPTPAAKETNDPRFISSFNRGFRTATASDHQYQIAKARSHHEPNVALVLATPHDDITCDVMPVAHLGIEMFQLDDLVVRSCLCDHFDRDRLEPGLYLFKEAKFHAWSHQSSEGTEYDTELEGTYVPATEADLAMFDMTIKALGEELSHYLVPEAERDDTDFIALARSQFLSSEMEASSALTI